MALIKLVSTMHRPSTEFMFRDSTHLNDLNNEFHNMPVDWTMQFYDNGLTRVLTQYYDSSIQPELDALYEKYAAEMAGEKARRDQCGITVQVETRPMNVDEVRPDIGVLGRARGWKVVKSISTRPNTDVLFGNGKITADHNNENHDMPIDVSTSYSNDMLTRVKVVTYDEALDPALQALREKYATSIQTEGVRQWTEGVRTTMVNITDLANPIFYLDQLNLEGTL